MNKNRFIRIIKAIYNNETISSKDFKDLKELILKFNDEEEMVNFLTYDRRILDKRAFFEFISWYLGYKVDDISLLDKKPSSKKENIEYYNSSKKIFFKTSKNILIYRKRGKNSEIFYKAYPQNIKKIVAVENLETFFELDESLFSEYEDFIYLGGFANEFTRKFLEDKEVLFFVDFDFYGLKIFNSFNIKKKDIFLPNNLEELIIQFGDKKLYLKQNCNLILNNENAKKIYHLIKKHSKVLEQEILNVN